MPSRERAHLVNLLSGIKGVHLLGSVSSAGAANLAIFNSVLHVGANPAALAVLFRPLTVRRNSFENIRQTGVFTLNLVTGAMLDAAHHTSAKWDAGESEFEHTGLTPWYSDGHAAPYVAESPIGIGLRKVEEQTLAYNGTVLMVGEVTEVRLPEDVRNTGGWMRLDSHDILSVAGLDSYYRGQLVARKAYANPGDPPADLPQALQTKA